MSIALVIEDDSGNATLLATRLAHLGYEVVSTMNPQAALFWAHLSPPDVAFVDLSLNGDVAVGLRLLALLREDPETAATRRIVHSVYEAVAEEAFASGLATGVLPKPYSKVHLHALLPKQ